MQDAKVNKKRAVFAALFLVYRLKYGWLAVDVQAARELFYREDFPTIKVGKTFKVMKSAFIDWCRKRRV